MLLHLPRQRIEITRARMIGERLPRRQSSPRGFYRAIDVRRRSLGHSCELFAGRRIRGVEISPGRGRMRRTVDEMPEAAAMAVQPGECFARILRRGPVLHGHEFLDDTHSLFLNSVDIEKNLPPTP